MSRTKVFRLLFGAAASIGAASPTLAAGAPIDASHKFSWAENVGWMNWRDANGGASGVRAGCVFLSGYVWCENIGWMNLGDGTPGTPAGYSNLNGTDFGVNVSATGQLSGFAWSENTGWINFSGGALATPANAARLDLPGRRFRGYAWGENIGWINLDDATHYAGVSPCSGDANGDGVVNFADITIVLANFNAASVPPGCQGAGDANADGLVAFADITTVLANFNAVCP